MTRAIYIGLFLFAVVTLLFSQENTGTILGVVRSSNGEALYGATVIIRQTRQGCSTGIEGNFNLKFVRQGEYDLEISYLGYEKQNRKVILEAGITVRLEIVMKQTAFQIGEIQVVGTAELVPNTPETKTTISSAEIEHYQASSVGDVLDLVPGVQKTANPGLGKTLQVGVRGDQSDALTAFGTKVIVDGVPISNNANLQFEKWTGSITGSSNVGRGVDMRVIPADNIEAIEVYRGVPSVKYGELTSGLINVKTKIGPQPNRLKIKSNPDTKEANFGGGLTVGGTGLSYNLNAAQSERDIRVSGDEFSRLTGQLIATSKFWSDAFTLNNKILGQRIFDEEQPKDDVEGTRNYNRGYTLQYSLWGEWKKSEVSSLSFNTFLTYRRENSMKSKMVSGEFRILPTGDTVTIYRGKVETRGNEWTLGGRFEWQRTYSLDEWFHTVLAGGEFQYDANTGDGVLIDSLYNYYGSSSMKRSYRFDDIPGQTLVSLYAEDKITGNLGVDFSFVFGARYELYRPFTIDWNNFFSTFIRSRQGSYLNPRTSLMLFFSPSSQLRFSAGYLSKSPPMSSIYAPPEEFKWRDPIQSKVKYFVVNRKAPDLKAYRERQVEVSYDQKIANLFGFSLTGYYKYRYNQPSSSPLPVFYVTSSPNAVYLYYIYEDSKPGNFGWNVSKGFEFSFRSKKIEPLNLELQAVGSYNYNEIGSTTWSFDEAPDASRGRLPNYPVSFTYGGVQYDTLFGFKYPRPGQWTDNILLNYYLRYTVPSLGLWVSIRAEHLIWKRTQDINLEPVDFSVMTPTAIAQRNFDESIRKQPAKWLFNLNISKSLFKGAEVSFFVNNFLDDPSVYKYQRSYDPNDVAESSRNPDLFYGLEFSMSFDALMK